MISLINEFFNGLKDFSDSYWFYVIILVIAILDSVIPIVPSETLVIIGGVSAGSGSLSLGWVMACAFSGAFIGDHLSYFLGRRASEPITRRYERTEKGKHRLASVIHQIHERGGMLLITARFIPGGRTILTLACGITKQERKWFTGWIIAAAAVWSTYASLLGFIGGKTFEDNHALAFGFAFGCAISVTGVIELARFILKKRKSQ
jgi:membrane protein DedA with SNARE-associated domain